MDFLLSGPLSLSCMMSGIFLKLPQRDFDVMVMGWADDLADISEQSEQGEELRSHLSQFCVTGLVLSMCKDLPWTNEELHVNFIMIVFVLITCHIISQIPAR
jgi:hypothetical protein